MIIPEIDWRTADIVCRHTRSGGGIGYAQRQIRWFQKRLWPDVEPWTWEIDHVAQLVAGRYGSDPLEKGQPFLSEAVLDGVRMASLGGWFGEIDEDRGEWVVVLRPDLSLEERSIVANNLVRANGLPYGYLDFRPLWAVGSAPALWRRCMWRSVSRHYKSTPLSRHCSEHLVRAMTGCVAWLCDDRGRFPHDWYAQPDLVGPAPMADRLLRTGQARVVWASKNAPLAVHDLVMVG